MLQKAYSSARRQKVEHGIDCGTPSFWTQMGKHEGCNNTIVSLSLLQPLGEKAVPDLNVPKLLSSYLFGQLVKHGLTRIQRYNLFCILRGSKCRKTGTTSNVKDTIRNQVRPLDRREVPIVCRTCRGRFFFPENHA